MDKKSRFLTLFVLVFFTVLPARAQQDCPPLGHCADPSLQRSLERRLQSLGLAEAAKSKSLCVALVDITNPSSPRMAAVNGNKMMYAASLPKIAILLGAFDRIARGDLALDDETRGHLTRMIRNSSNHCANIMLNRVGKSHITSLLQSPQYRLYDPERNGGLWIGKEYGKAPAWKRDPIHNLSHGATAFQAARFYYLMENGLLVSPEMSKEMKSILARPAIHHKFVKGLEKARPSSRVYRKSGTWRQYHSDSAVIERDGRRYIAVALANSPKGEKWLRHLIVGMDELIFQSNRGSAVRERFSLHLQPEARLDSTGRDGESIRLR